MTETEFSNLLEKASKYFQVFDGKDFWIPAPRTPLHLVLEEYVRIDSAGRIYASENFDWEDGDFNDFWNFLPCGKLLDYCESLEDNLPEMEDKEFLTALQKYASDSPYDPWDEI